ncbi:MAG: sigma-E processing peptidase SpoIIGA [Bacillota bacterium]|nr:sigma-E processing peptidase SpoIIGA [Bacillota bacterium]
MEVYIDVIFLVTWGMDALLLWMAGRLAGFSAKGWRLFLGGFLSALCYCLWLCLFWESGGFFLSAFLLTMGLFAAYHPKSGRNWLRLWGAGWAASFLLGGGTELLFTFTQSQRLFGQGLVVERTAPWWILPWSMGLSYLALKKAEHWLTANIQRRREYCTFRLLYEGRGIEGRFLIDTGNGLRKEGRGVAVTALSAVLPLFPKGEQVRLLSGRREGLEWLPFTSLGNPEGRLWGIRAEKLLLSYGEKTITHRDIFVGISGEDFTGAYEGIVPPVLLEEE